MPPLKGPSQSTVPSDKTIQKGIKKPRSDVLAHPIATLLDAGRDSPKTRRFAGNDVDFTTGTSRREPNESNPCRQAHKLGACVGSSAGPFRRSMNPKGGSSRNQGGNRLRYERSSWKISLTITYRCEEQRSNGWLR